MVFAMVSCESDAVSRLKYHDPDDNLSRVGTMAGEIPTVSMALAGHLGSDTMADTMNWLWQTQADTMTACSGVVRL